MMLIFDVIQGTVTLNTVYKSIKNVKGFQNSVMGAGNKRKPNENICRWLQILCRITLLQFVSFAVYEQLETDTQLFPAIGNTEGHKPLGKHYVVLKQVLEQVYGMKSGDMDKEIPPKMNFRKFVKMFQELHHVPAIVKCLERSVQSSKIEDIDTEQWYRPTKQAVARSNTTNIAVEGMNADVLETTLDSLHFRIEHVNHGVEQALENDLYLIAFAENFLKPLIKVSGAILIWVHCEIPINIHVVFFSLANLQIR